VSSADACIRLKLVMRERAVLDQFVADIRRQQYRNNGNLIIKRIGCDPMRWSKRTTYAAHLLASIGSVLLALSQLQACSSIRDVCGSLWKLREHSSSS